MIIDNIIEKDVLLETIFEKYSCSESVTLLKVLCEKLGTKQLYNSLNQILNEKMFNFLLNPLSEKYQQLLKANIIQGSDYLERSRYFLKYINEDFETFLSEYPILRDKLPLQIEVFYKENIKILESFQNNLEDIKKRLTCNEAIRISSISDTEGDRHNSTSVKIILLQNDKKIVYKPRSIATDCAVYSVAEYIFSKLGETVYFP